MKIAVASDDGRTVSSHFGRAKYFVVVRAEGGEIIEREMRDKWGPGAHREDGCADRRDGDCHGSGHGQGPQARARHKHMLALVEDCDVIVSRGMGQGMRQHLDQQRRHYMLTRARTIESAVDELVSGHQTGTEQTPGGT